MEFREEILSNIRRGNIGVIPLKGISMLPTLPDGTVLFVCAQLDYYIGDIVVFYYPTEGYLVHRIVEIKEGAILCRGDNSKRVEVIMKRQIIGKVVNYITGEN